MELRLVVLGGRARCRERVAKAQVVRLGERADPPNEGQGLKPIAETQNTAGRRARGEPL